VGRWDLDLPPHLNRYSALYGPLGSLYRDLVEDWGVAASPKAERRRNDKAAQRCCQVSQDVVETAMSDLPPETSLRYEKAIKEQWNCQAMYSYRADCQQESCGDGAVYVFGLSQAPTKWPEAKHCFVWDCKNFKEGGEGVAVVLDKQVVMEAEREAGEADEKYFPRLALAAVIAWQQNCVPRKPDEYVDSKNQSKEKLDGQQVEYGLPALGMAAKKYGSFRVRERSDKKIAVRIFDRDEWKISLPIREVDRIEEPDKADTWFVYPLAVGFE
jgi:hypothetical protein